MSKDIMKKSITIFVKANNELAANIAMMAGYFNLETVGAEEGYVQVKLTNIGYVHTDKVTDVGGYIKDNVGKLEKAMSAHALYYIKHIFDKEDHARSEDFYEEENPNQWMTDEYEDVLDEEDDDDEENLNQWMSDEYEDELDEEDENIFENLYDIFKGAGRVVLDLTVDGEPLEDLLKKKQKEYLKKKK